MNCKALPPVIRNKFQHYIYGLFAIRSFKIFAKEFFKKTIYKNTPKLKTFFIAYCTTNILLQSKILKSLFHDITQEDFFYFYWGVGASYMLPFLSFCKAKTVVRFHGEWDLYEERSGGYSPLRENIVQCIDLAVFISKKGYIYFENKYPTCNLNSIVSYLGTEDHGTSEKSDDGIFRLLSCSKVIPLKRVLTIYESLQLIHDVEIEWTHIGNGIEFEKLKKLIKSSNLNIKIKLLGRLSNRDVISYYQRNKFDAFINVSSIEGLPVSLMEAISFNIPVIGTDVGGTSEIVTCESGILLSPNPTCQEIANAILNIRKLEIHPKQFWNKLFNANVNYPKFIENVLKH